MKYTDYERRIISMIGYFFLREADSDYDLCFKMLDHMDITHLRVYKKIGKNRPDIIYITLARPGLLIGSKGKIIKALEKHIEEETGRKSTFYIIENNIKRILYPMTIKEAMEVGGF